MLEDITTEQIKHKFQSNKILKFVTIGVGALILAVLGYFLYLQFSWKPANEKSKESYWAGLNYASMDSTEMAIDELKRNTKKFDGKIGGEVSQFVYARQLMETGEFKKAITELEGVDVSDTYVSVMAIGLQADCYSELEDYETAANLYLEAADANKNDMTTPMYLFKAGICAEEIKNIEKAQECYQRIKDDFPSFASQKQIEKYIARASSKTIE
jgi:tetratricopeptide (TPR) repeat protein